MQQLHMLQLNAWVCTDLSDHCRRRKQVVKVFVPQNIHHHISSWGHIYNMIQYDKKTQGITKSILGKSTHISTQCFEEPYNYFALLSDCGGLGASIPTYSFYAGTSILNLTKVDYILI